MQEAAGFGYDVNDFARAGNVQTVQRANWRFRLAGRSAEGREIVTAKKQLSRGVHPDGVERGCDMPYATDQ